ncbi:unnamed protein product [Eretmochelys imbricata]
MPPPSPHTAQLHLDILSMKITNKGFQPGHLFRPGLRACSVEDRKWAIFYEQNQPPSLCSVQSVALIVLPEGKEKAVSSYTTVHDHQRDETAKLHLLPRNT